MTKNSRLYIVTIAIIIFLSFINTKAAAIEELNQSNIVGQSAILINASSGQIIWGKNENLQLAPASTTKIMTGLLALERGNLQEEVITSKRAIYAEGTRVYLEEGEKKTLEDLTYALLLNSGNDAAIAIAESIGGNVEDFVTMMNNKAKDIGAVNTQFKNPNGLPDVEHYSTAADLALIAKEAMNNETFRTIVAAKTRKWPGDKWFGPLINHNKLLWRYKGTNGIKTGYTVAAGQCLVASAKRDNTELIAVVLNSKGRNVYTDITRLFDYGFNNFTSEKLISKNQTIESIKIEGQQNVPLLSTKEVTYTKLQGLDNPTKQINIKKDIQLPIKTGEILGYLQIKFPGQSSFKVPLIAGISVPKKKAADIKKSNTIGIVITALGILFLIRLRVIIKKRKRREKRRLRRLKELEENRIV